MVVMLRNLIIIAVALCMIPFASAAQEVNIGAYVLNVGKYELATGSYTIDFYLSIKCDQKCDPNIEFMNGRATSLEKIIDKPNDKFYRIQASLQEQVNLESFPFDEQKLTILIEDKEKPIDDFMFIPNADEAGLDPAVKFVGWQIQGWQHNTTIHNYEVYDEQYSQYQFEITIGRSPFNAVLKTLLPVFFIVLITLFSFIIDPDKITNRLTLVTSSLVAAVMFHVNIANQLPPVGYLTFADKFMVLTYVVLLFSLATSIVLLELSERKDERVTKIHRATEYTGFIVVPLMYVLLFVFGL